MGAHLVEHRLGIGAQNAVRWSRHAQIGDVARAAGKHPTVGGGDVGVGAENHLHPPVQVVAHGQLLGGSLGVEIQKGDVVLSLLSVKNTIHHGEGIIERIHKRCSRQVHAENPQTADLPQGIAHPGAGGRIIGGADDSIGVVVQEGVDIPAPEGVVAQGDEIHTAVQKSLGVGTAEPVDLGGVLPVADHKIRPQLGRGSHQSFGQVFNGTATNHVANGENFHKGYSFYARMGGISDLGLSGSGGAASGGLNPS